MRTTNGRGCLQLIRNNEILNNNENPTDNLISVLSDILSEEEEENGILLRVMEDDVLLEVMIIPFNQKIYGHFIDAALEDSRHVKGVPLTLKWPEEKIVHSFKMHMREIHAAEAEVKYVMGIGNRENEDNIDPFGEKGQSDPLFLMMSKACYSQLRELL